MSESFGGRPERKKMSAAELAQFQQDRRQETQKQLEALPQARKEMVGNLTYGLQESLVMYLRTPGADSLVLNDLKDLLDQLGNSLAQAGSGASNPEGKTQRLKDALQHFREELKNVQN